MYSPPQEILQKYAQILVNFALNDGKGIKKDEVVRLVVPVFAKPLGLEIDKAILRSGGHSIVKIIDEDYTRLFYDEASTAQLEHFPKEYFKAMINLIDHQIAVLGEINPHYLNGVDPVKQMISHKASKPYMDWRNKKEDEGRFTWTLGLYGTEGLAKEAGISLEEYWNQIIKACFLDESDPVAKWKAIMAEVENAKHALNEMPINKIHIESEGTDLWLTLGEKRKWNGGSGRNIPSFEIFTSPDWRGTEGVISFDMPLYRFGNLIKDITLEFKEGRVTKATASHNEEILLEMIKQEGAYAIGEFSMTDKRFSRIDTFMAETLYDENFGGEHGNTHIALGMSYHDCYEGDPQSVSEDEWKNLGYNDSAIHTDIIQTTDRTITAVLRDGSEKVIYQNGMFTFI